MKRYMQYLYFFLSCAHATGQKNEIVVCGDDKVWIVNVDNSEGKKFRYRMEMECTRV